MTDGPALITIQSSLARGACRAVIRAGIPSITFHGLRHSFVAILIAARCSVWEVSEWADHNSVAFTLTRLTRC
jgi:integrase